MASTFLPSYRGRLTEGSTYDARSNSLLWVDIIAAQVHRVELDGNGLPVEETHQQINILADGESVGAISLTKDTNRLLVCAKYGVAEVQFSGKLVEIESLEYIVKYPQELHGEDMRSNDALVDPWGNLWVGTMLDFKVGHVDPKGVLYRIGPDWSIKVMLTECQISNGLSFLKNGSKLFWTDSLTFTIWSFDFDPEKIELSNRQPFIDTRNFATLKDISSPEPDGFTTSEDGEIFTCVFSSSRVFRFDTKGNLAKEYNFPAQRITSCVFGGPKKNILYVTSGQLNLDKPDLCQSATEKLGDLGGFLFLLPIDEVTGKEKNLWAHKLTI